jgi:hypothetical protein
VDGRVNFVDWTREMYPDAIVLIGAGGDRLRIRPRVARARPPIELVEESVLEHGARIRERATPIELTTPEGERAQIAWASLDGGRTCAAAVVANVMTIDAITDDALTLVEQLVRDLGVGLGERRHRDFVYVAPQGWSRVDHVGATEWRHHTSTATVYRARPFTATSAERFHRELFVQLPRGFRTRQVLPIEDVTSTAGLVGRLRSESGQRRGVDAIRMAASFGDDRFLYLAHFEGDVRDALAFRALIATFEPIPLTFRAVGLSHFG